MEGAEAEAGCRTLKSRVDDARRGAEEGSKSHQSAMRCVRCLWARLGAHDDAARQACHSAIHCPILVRVTRVEGLTLIFSMFIFLIEIQTFYDPFNAISRHTRGELAKGPTAFFESFRFISRPSNRVLPLGVPLLTASNGLLVF